MPNSIVIAWALVVVYCLVALVSTGVVVVSWRRRKVTAAGRYLAVAMAGCLTWVTADLLMMLAGLGVLARPAAQAGGLLILPAAATVMAPLWCLSRVVVAPEWRPRRRTVALLAVHPVAMGFVAATGFAADRFLTLRQVASDGPWPGWTPGWGFWIHIGFSYLLFSASAVNLIRAWVHGSPLQRRQAGALLVSGLVPLPANIVAISLIRAGGPEITGVAFAVTVLIDAYALLRYGFGEIVPVARSLVFRRLHDAVLVIALDGRLLDANDAGERLLRALAPSLPGPLAGLDLTTIDHEFLGGLTSTGHPPDGEPTRRDHQVDLPTGPAVLDVRGEVLADRRGRAVARLVVIRDVTELHARRHELSEANERLRAQLATIDRLREHLAEQAVRDELTGLHNRRHLVARLEEDVSVALLEGTDLCVAILDIDHFKSVNDQHGHATGDALLAAIAQALAAAMHGNDTLARYGGEEFVVLLPGTTPAQAMARAQEWRLRCSEVTVASRLGPVSRTISIGVTGLRRQHAGRATPNVLLQEADDALYAAKTSGRNRVVLANDIDSFPEPLALQPFQQRGSGPER